MPSSLRSLVTSFKSHVIFCNASRFSLVFCTRFKSNVPLESVIYYHLFGFVRDRSRPISLFSLLFAACTRKRGRAHVRVTIIYQNFPFVNLFRIFLHAKAGILAKICLFLPGGFPFPRIWFSFPPQAATAQILRALPRTTPRITRTTATPVVAIPRVSFKNTRRHGFLSHTTPPIRRYPYEIPRRPAAEVSFLSF